MFTMAQQRVRRRVAWWLVLVLVALAPMPVVIYAMTSHRCERAMAWKFERLIESGELKPEGRDVGAESRLVAQLMAHGALDTTVIPTGDMALSMATSLLLLVCAGWAYMVTTPRGAAKPAEGRAGSVGT